MVKWCICALLTFVLFSVASGQAGAKVAGYTLDYGGDTFWIESNPAIDSLSTPSVAVALGGGGARALVNVGVLKALEEEGIPVDLVVGTSMGAVVAVMYGSGIPIDQIEQLVTQADFTSLFDLNFPFTKSLVDPSGLNGFLEEVAPAKRLDDFPIPTALLSFELNEGVKYVQTTGPLSIAVQGAYAIPFCFPGQEVEGSFLIDAGIQELTPAKAAKALGADYVISTTAFDELPYDVYDNALRSFMRMINLIKEDFSREIVQLYSDRVIAHDVGKYSFMDFQLAKDFINLGYVRTKEELPYIKQALAEKGIPLRTTPEVKRAIDIDRWLLDVRYDRLDLGHPVVKPRLYIGQKYAPLSSSVLFRENEFSAHWGVEAKYRRFRASVLGDFAGTHAGAELRWVNMLPKADFLTRLSTDDQGYRAAAGLVEYWSKGSIGLGVAEIANKAYLHAFGSSDRSEIELIWAKEDVEYTASHQVSVPIRTNWSLDATIGASDTDYLSPAPLYTGQPAGSGRLFQALVGISHRSQFAYSLEILQIIQVTGVDQQVFWWGGKQDAWERRVGISTSLEVKLLGLKPAQLDAYVVYDPQSSETVSGLELNVSL